MSESNSISNGLRVLLWNPATLEGKGHEIHMVARHEQGSRRPDVMLLSECKLHPDHMGRDAQFTYTANRLRVPGWEAHYLADRSGHGGVTTQVRASITHRVEEQWQPRDRPPSSRCTLQWTELRVPGLIETVMVGVVYIPPERSQCEGRPYLLEADKRWLSDSMHYVAERKMCVLAGDFNARHAEFGDRTAAGQPVDGADSDGTNSDSEGQPARRSGRSRSAAETRGRWLHEVMLSAGMTCVNGEQVPDQATHRQGGMLDLVFTNCHGLITDMVIERELGLTSDHYPVMFTIGVQQLADVQHRQEQCERKQWRLAKAKPQDWEGYQRMLSQSLCDYKTEVVDKVWHQRRQRHHIQALVDDAYAQLLAAIFSAADCWLGRKRRNGRVVAWWDSDADVQSLWTAMRAAQAAATASPTDEAAATAARSARARFRSVAAATKKRMWAEFCSRIEDDRDRKLMWSVWHQSLGSDRSPLTSIPDTEGELPTDGRTALDNMAEAFAKISNVPKPRSGPAKRHAHRITLSAWLLRRVNPLDEQLTAQPLLDEPLTVAEVSSSAHRMRCNTAAGPDDLPGMLIKRGGSGLHAAMTDLFNLTWRLGQLPIADSGGKLT
jgi:exonuclease III